MSFFKINFVFLTLDSVWPILEILTFTLWKISIGWSMQTKFLFCLNKDSVIHQNIHRSKDKLWIRYLSSNGHTRSQSQTQFPSEILEMASLELFQSDWTWTWSSRLSWPWWAGDGTTWLLDVPCNIHDSVVSFVWLSDQIIEVHFAKFRKLQVASSLKKHYAIMWIIPLVKT